MLRQLLSAWGSSTSPVPEPGCVVVHGGIHITVQGDLNVTTRAPTLLERQRRLLSDLPPANMGAKT